VGEKTRRPYLLGDDDFDTFNYVDMKAFLASENSLPNRPEHLVAMQANLADAFHVKLDEYRYARNAQKIATTAFGEAAKTVREKLRWMKMALPGLTPGSAEILVPFGLDSDVSADNDKMKNFADVVFAHWQTVRDEPLFAPFQSNIDALESDLNAYVVTQANQNAAIQTAQLLQNEKDEARKQSEGVLDALIDWYRIYYKSPQDEYWTQTPWGKSSGEGEPPAPVWPDWPGPVEASAVQIGEGLVRITFSGLNGGKTLRIERLKQGDADYVLVTQGLPLDDPEEVMPFDDDHLDKKKYTYKLTPFDEGGNPGTSALVGVTVS